MIRSQCHERTHMHTRTQWWSVQVDFVAEVGDAYKGELQVHQLDMHM